MTAVAVSAAARFFAALGDETRLALLAHLRGQPLPPGDGHELLALVGVVVALAVAEDDLVAVGAEAEALAQGFDAAGRESHYFSNLNDAADWLGRNLETGDRLLVKGSRSAAMAQPE